MPPIRRIIAGVSGSSRSLPALRWAAHLAHLYEAELFPVHTWLPPCGAWAGYQFPSEHLCREWEAAAEQRLGEALALAFGGLPPGLRVWPVIAEGTPGKILVQAACQADDLLVIGTGRRVAVTRLWHGGVSRYCLAHAGCPVIAIPPPALEREARQLTTRPGAAASVLYVPPAPSALRVGGGHGRTGWRRRPGRRR
jgi:nucleotide-binding universal stress UspA family protein